MPDVNKVDVQNAKNSRKESESKSTRVSQKVENLDKVDASAKDTCGANELTCRYKFVLTFVLYFCHFFYAMNFYITGPTLLDLTRIYNTNAAQIANINVSRMCAYMVGSLNGFLFRYVNRHLAVSIFLLMIAATMALTPHWPSMSWVLGGAAVNGFASGGIESASDVWVLEMWQEECGPFVQALHFAFGAGSIVAPLVVRPFLNDDVVIIDLSTLMNLTESSSQQLLTNITYQYNFNNPSVNTMQAITMLDLNSSQLAQTNSSDVIPYESRIYIPYAIGGACIAVGGTLLFFLFLYRRYEPPKSRQALTKVDPDKNVFGNLLLSIKQELMPSKFVLYFVVIAAFFMAIFLGMEWQHFLYFPAFAHFSSLRVAEQKAAEMATGMAAAFTLGRALSIPIAVKLRPHQILYGCLCLMLVGTAFLFFAESSEAIMWVANVFYGLGFSAVYASVYALIEEQTTVGNFIGALIILTSGLSAALYPKFLGAYIEENPLILVHINLVSIFVCFFLLLFIHIPAKRRNQFRDFEKPTKKVAQ